MNQQKFLTRTPSPVFIGKYGFAFIEKPNESEKGWFRIEMTDAEQNRATATVRFIDVSDKSDVPGRLSDTVKMFKAGNAGIFLAELQFSIHLGRDKDFRFYAFDKDKTQD